MHYLLLRADGSALADFFPDLSPDAAPAADAYPAFRDFCLSHRDELLPILAERTTQTNEVGRCAFLLPAIELISREARRPLALIEIGCSAGLNLLFDRYRYEFGSTREVGDSRSPVRIRTEVKGERLPPLPKEMPAIAQRAGLDRAPIDVRDADSRLWLEACVWPEQRERRDLLMGAFEVARPDPPRLVTGDAIADIGSLIETAPAGAHLVVMHTTVYPYIEADRQPEFAAVLRDAVSSRDASWLLCEPSAMAGVLLPDRRDVIADLDPTSFALGLVTQTGQRLLAAAHTHGKWIEWLEGI